MDSSARSLFFDEAEQSPPVVQLAQDEDAREFVPRERRADGCCARRQHEVGEMKFALLLATEDTDEGTRGENLQRLRVQMNLNIVLLAKIFGRVDDESFEFRDQAGDNIGQAARPVGDVCGLLDDGDVQIGCSATRLHGRRKSGGNSADDE